MKPQQFRTPNLWDNLDTGFLLASPRESDPVSPEAQTRRAAAVVPACPALPCPLPSPLRRHPTTTASSHGYVQLRIGEEGGEGRGRRKNTQIRARACKGGRTVAGASATDAPQTRRRRQPEGERTHALVHTGRLVPAKHVALSSRSLVRLPSSILKREGERYAHEAAATGAV